MPVGFRMIPVSFIRIADVVIEQFAERIAVSVAFPASYAVNKAPVIRPSWTFGHLYHPLSSAQKLSNTVSEN